MKLIRVALLSHSTIFVASQNGMLGNAETAAFWKHNFSTNSNTEHCILVLI